MHIIKRDGTTQEFDVEKIVTAITKANNSIPEEDRITAEEIRSIAKSIEGTCGLFSFPVTVEKIQDMVEDELINKKHNKLAKDYITYRYLHKLMRDKYKDLMDKVSDKLLAKHVVNSNANLDEFSFGGRTGETASVITKEYALKYLMSDKARKAHEDNTIYTHDLDSYSIGDHNCLTVPMDYLLKHGFNTRQTDVRPARSLNTAFQLIAVLFQLQSLQQFGGTSSGHSDSTLAPYVRISFFKHFRTGMKYLLHIEGKEFEDWCNKNDINLDGSSSIDDKNYKWLDGVYKYAMDMTEKECRQGAEGLFHNLEIWVA